MASRSSLLTVVYTGEPDEVFAFSKDGQSRTFGRGDTCEIIIWSAINGRELSRAAGRIWRMSNELWLRNLSTRHELTIVTPDMPAEPVLPPRRNDGVDPGPARSIPPGVTFVRAPGGCDLLIRQEHNLGDAESQMVALGEDTIHLPPVPRELLNVAAALCEPLLRGGHLPAAYSEIKRRAALGSLKKTRILVSQLCMLYVNDVPALRDRIIARRREEERRLELPVDPRLHRGLWTFDPVHRGDDTEEVRRRRALALPDYYEVAHLLVRRHMITMKDLISLGAFDDTGTPPAPQL